LLVVIAIIAILAAILFPVFSKAKAAARRISDLSNIRQLSLATIIYQADFDDLCPLESGIDANGVWGYDIPKDVPYNWDASLTGTPTEAYSQSFVDNTVQPYTRNGLIQSIPGAPTDSSKFKPTDPVLPGLSRRVGAYAYNGLLNAYNSAAIASSASLPIWTETNGFINETGWGMANPILFCQTPSVACVFQPAALGCSPSVNGAKSKMSVPESINQWINGQGQNWAFADGHAKWRLLSGSPADPKLSPWFGFDSNGNSDNTFYVDPQGCHALLFQPDREG
jgi:prepilin-type processing-associated H-X9-DG protein